MANDTTNREPEDRKQLPLLQRLGPGLITGRRGRRPERHRHLLAGRGAVRLRDALVGAVHHAAHGRHPDRERAHRPRDGPRARGQHPRPFPAAGCCYGVVALLLFANTLNIAADLGAMGNALELLVGGDSKIYIVFFALISLTLQIFVPFPRYAPILKWLTLALLLLRGDGVRGATCRGRMRSSGALMPQLSFHKRLRGHASWPCWAPPSARTSSSGRPRRRSRSSAPRRATSRCGRPGAGGSAPARASRWTRGSA